MKTCLSLKSFFIIFLIIQLISSMHWETDTELHDLEYNGVEFVAEASHWYCSSLIRPDNKTYNCNGVYYLGGYNIMNVNQNNYFQRTYYTLPAHNQVRINMTLFMMDNPETNDFMDLKIDGTLISGFTSGAASMTAYTTPICGGGANDYPPFNISFTYPHTSTSSITIQTLANMNAPSWDESIALRDLTIEFQTVASPTSSKCAISSKPLWTSNPVCACPLPNQYQNPANSGTCSFCDPTCATCSGSAATQCASCYPFTDRYQSGSQCLSCFTGCATCLGGGQYQCTSCKSGYYLANDNSCYSSCDFPLYVQGETGSVPLLPYRCLSPCPTPQYLLWDGTCSSTCAFPLDSSTFKNSYSYCRYPCSDSQYLYFNRLPAKYPS